MDPFPITFSGTVSSFFSICILSLLAGSFLLAFKHIQSFCILRKISPNPDPFCSIKVVRVVILVLFLILEEKLSPFHCWIYWLWGCCIQPVLGWDMFPPYPLCSEFSFYHELMLTFIDAFSDSLEMVIWFLSLIFLMSCITLIDLHILKNPCIPGVKPTWSL